MLYLNGNAKVSSAIICKVFKEKTKPIFTENISATAFINSLLSTSHSSLMLHFKSHNLHISMNQIIATTKFFKKFFKLLFYKVLKTL